MKTLLGLLLGLNLIQPAPLDEVFARDQLLVLPSPLILPDFLPEGFKLVDTRLHRQPLARWGEQFSYSLVYTSENASFMLQTQLPNYQPRPECQKQVQRQSHLLQFQGYQAPQQVLLYSPACDLSGNKLAGQAISAQEVQKIWQHLSWYQRQEQKFIYLRPLAPL